MKNYYLTAIIWFLSFTLFAQKESPTDSTKNANLVTVANATNLSNLLPQLTPKSPNVASLGRYGEYPVNLNTGLPNIEIPIFNIEVKGITLPIKLSYHASGNKVTDVASFVGLGWALQYGGSVNRQLRSLADESNAGLLGKTVPVDIQASQGAICYNEDVRSYYQGLAEGYKDAERDIFSLNIPSKSNQFILRDTTNYQWINPEPTKVRFSRATNSSNSNSTFTITDEGGSQFLFGETETTSGVGVSSWLLTQIQGIRPQDKILFEYNAAENFTSTHDIMESVTLNDNPTGNPPSGITWATPGSSPTVNLVSINNSIDQKLPKTIHFPSGKIEFVLETTNRQDGYGNALDKIEIYGFNTVSLSYHLIKTYDLNFIYKNRTDNSPVLFLNEVSMLDSLGTQIGKYQLGYESTALPEFQSKARDYWGYYNGATGNTTLIPSHSEAVSFQNSSGTVSFGGGNRLANEDYMKAWVLNKITYPTGGYSQFKYEANRYLNGTTLTQAGGLRILSITSTPNSNSPAVTKAYRYGIDGNGAGTLRQSLSLQYSTEQKVLNCQSNTTGSPCATNYTYRVRTYTSNLSGALFPHEGSPVTYPEVTEYEDSLATGRNGKAVYQYREASDNQITLNRGAKFFVNSKHWNRGQLVSKKIYGRDTKIKYKLENTYQVMGAGITQDLCGRLVQTQSIYDGNRNQYINGSSLCYSDIDDYQPSQTYFFEYGTTQLVKSEEYLYDNTDDTKYTLKTKFTDYIPDYYFPRLSREVVNAGEIRAKKFFYAFDYNNIPSSSTGELFSIRRLLEKNQINAPIEEVSYFKSSLSSTDSLISGAKITSPYSKEDNSSGTYKSLFVSINKIYLLESQQYNAFGATPYQSSADLYNAAPSNYTSNLPKHSLYDLKLTMDYYDFYGNLNSYSIANGRTDSFYYQDYSHNGVRLSTLTGQTQDYGGLNHTTNYAYTTPLLGLSSIKAPNGVYTYFTYDSFGRLKTISDHNKKVLKEYAYDYTNRSITEWLPREELSNVSVNTSSANAIKTVSFVDGLGRDLQKVIANGSPDASKDIISSHVLYDTVGRVYKSYLASPSSLSGGSFLSLTNLQSAASTFYGDTKPFTETTVFDNSPLNRAITNFGAGNAWRTANKSIDVSYQVAPANTVKRFKASLSAVFCNVEGQATTIDYYGANELEKRVTTSERGKKVTEYIDLQGRVVQKEVEVSSDTILTVAYCYDLYDRLAYVIQPKTFNLFSSSRAYIFDTESDSKEGIFVYKYDRKGQLIQKRVVGQSDFEVMVYDKLYRLVLNRDAGDDEVTDNFGRSRFKFTKYDALNRPVMGGLTFLTQGFDRQTLQNDFDAHPANLVNEVRGTALRGYANTSFPTNYTPIENTLRMVTYYDNYSWQTESSYNFQESNSFGTRWTDSYIGLTTGSLIRNVEALDWYKSVGYFDFKGRLIQSFSQNVRGNIDRSEVQYHFNGEILKTRSVHEGITEISEYFYDHLGRKLRYLHTKNGKTQKVATYSYDGIGRMNNKSFSPREVVNSSQTGEWNATTTWLNNFVPTISDNVVINTGHTVTIPSGQAGSAGSLNDKGTLKNFGTLYLGTAQPNSGAGVLGTIGYAWHIRGGLKGINLDGSGNLSNSLFSMKLGYEDDGNYYDGNIRSQSWKSSLDGLTRTFTYAYDGSSRIKSAAYSGGKTGETFALNNVSYDANGNILSLSRNGVKTNNSFGLIDNLNYTYLTNSNKIQKIDDISNETASFNDVSGNDYTYYADGSLKSDANKGVTLIEYNYLKQPQKITFSNSQTIEYQHDATGRKLREKAKDGTVTYYIDNLIYKGNNLSQIGIDDGRINAQGEYEYVIQDHLGNVRIMFKDSSGIAKITQTENFGAWGESLKGINYYQNTANKQQFVYTGHERNEELDVYDAKARMYDPTIARFWQGDVLADKYFMLNPYNYVANNPVRLIDPEGLDIWINFGEGQRVRYENGKVYNADGSKYKGNDSFVNTIVKNLNKMNSTEIGKIVLSALTDSKSDYSFVNANPKTNDGKEVQGLSFRASENGRGGTIQAGFLMSNLSKQTSQEGSNIESTAHELFHAYQSENGENGASINKEVGAYLYGKAVSTNLGFGLGGFGNLTKEGQLYDKSMTELMFSDKFNQKLYDTAINTFKTGGIGNNGTSGGIYNKFKIMPNDKNPVIKRLFPLMR